MTGGSLVWASPLVVVDDLYVVGVVAFGTEADAPLVDHTDAVLAGSITVEPLEPAAGRDLGGTLPSSGPAVERSTPPSDWRHLSCRSAMLGPRQCR